MEIIQQQIVALQVIVAQQQVSVKRQRFAILALTGIIVAGGFIAAVRPTGDATFDTITCKGWKVVDKDEKVRIAASTLADGTASVKWVDKDGKPRISAATLADGDAIVTWLDKDGKERIEAGSDDGGYSYLVFNDKDGKGRIEAHTSGDDGTASVTWRDKDKHLRFRASIEDDGTVVLPNEDHPPKKP